MIEGYEFSWVQPERYRYVVCIDGEPVFSAQRGDAAIFYILTAMQSAAVCMRSIAAVDSSNGNLLHWYERGV